VATITFLTITICRGTCIDVVQTKTYTITAISSILQTAMTSAAGDCIITIRSNIRTAKVYLPAGSFRAKMAISTVAANIGSI
jgi:hypothetical protein